MDWRVRTDTLWKSARIDNLNAGIEYEDSDIRVFLIVTVN